jgi:hypothetical protein
MRIFRRISITLLIIASLATIGYLTRRQLLKQVLPAVEQVVVESINVIDDSAYVKVLVMVRNKNWTSYELNFADITLSNDTLVLVHYVNDSVQKLEQNQVRVFPISFVIPIKDAIRRIRTLQDRDSTMITVKGWVEFTTMFGKSSRTFSKDVSVEVPVPPKITLGELIYLGEVKEGENYYDFRMKLRVINLNKKEFWFKDVNYKMDAGKQIHSVGKIPGDIRILPMDTVHMEIPFRVTIDKEMALLFKILINDDVVNYKFSVTGTVASLAGIHQDVPASFTTSGQVELYNPDRKKIKFTVLKDKDREKHSKNK